METKENVMNFAIEESQVVNKYFSEYTPIDVSVVKANPCLDNNDWTMMCGSTLILY